MEARLGWIAGIIDGEGSITVTSNPASKRQLNSFGQLQPKLTMWNTDQRLVSEFMDILDENNIPHHVFTQKPRGKNINKKVQFRVEIHGLKRIMKALPPIIPYLISKRGEAEAIMAFCASRLSRQQNSPYSEEEIRLANLTREIPLHA
jgi:hypothetical protein